MFKFIGRQNLIVLILLPAMDASSQTIGGNAVYNFLNLPVAAQASGLGGINISNQSNDLSMAYGNPSLLRDSMNSQVSTDFNLQYAGIINYFASAAYTPPNLHINFAFAINFLDYGSTRQTDAYGNLQGNFYARDYSIEFMASGKYEKNWYYGVSAKFINSSYGQYKSIRCWCQLCR